MTLKESRKQARIKITAAGLQWLISKVGNDKLASRKDIFRPTKTANQAEFSEASSNKWQAETLKRLEDAGLVEKIKEGSTILYTTGDERRIDAVLDNYVDGDGSLLSAIMWPSKKAPTAAVSNAKKDGILDDAYSEYQDENLLLKNATNKKSKENVDELIQKSSEEDIAQLIIKLIDILSQNQNVVVEKIDTIKNGVSTIIDKVDNLFDFQKNNFGIGGEFSKKIAANTKKIESLEKSITGVRQVLDANQSATKNVLTAAQGVKETAAELSKLMVALQASTAESKELRGGVQKLVDKMEESEKSKIDDIAKRMSQHIKDSETLRDMVFELVAEREK